LLSGRLGLETARVPYSDRHGLLWLERGRLYIEDGVLTFATAGYGELKAGTYQLPFQTVSNVLVAPGCVITHDAVRMLSRHGTGVIFIGSDGVRYYASMPFGQDDSDLARRQVTLWANRRTRLQVAKLMYAQRLDDEIVGEDIEVLRGIEGARMKETYRCLSEQFGVEWSGRLYDRNNPSADDPINTAINHASSAVRAAAMIAVSATSTIPQLGFIHETSSEAFALDIADLFRSSFMLPIAFRTVARQGLGKKYDLERTVRKVLGKELRRNKIIPAMIESIKEVLSIDDRSNHSESS